jgi:DnaJ-domain-containing protein 1
MAHDRLAVHLDGGIGVALLRILAIAIVVALVTRWLRRALAEGVNKRSPSGKPWWDNEDAREDSRPKLKTLKFRRDPHDVLELDRGASRAAIDEAFERLSAQNKSSSIAELSEEIQALAQRKTEELEAAYAALTEEIS